MGGDGPFGVGKDLPHPRDDAVLGAWRAPRYREEVGELVDDDKAPFVVDYREGAVAQVRGQEFHGCTSAAATPRSRKPKMG